MADERDDPTGGSGGSGGGAGGKATGTAQKARKLAKILKSLKTFGLLGTIFVWVIIAIVVILIIIGLLGFFLEMPSLMGDKLGEIKDSVFATIGSFLDGNKAYITEDDQLELAQYLENMGYPPYEFGFGELKEREEDGEISQAIDSKYLNAYLLADYNTYTVFDKVKSGISSFLHGAGEFFFGNKVENPEDEGTKTAHFGMLHFEKYNDTSWDIGDIWTDNIDIDVEKKILTLSASDWDGLINRSSQYAFNMDGWSARYGKPLDLSITLHLATMAPDLVYKLIMDEEENTAIYIGRTENQVRIRMKYKKNEGVTTNFGAISEDLKNLDEVDEFETDELQQIEDFIENNQGEKEIKDYQEVKKNVDAFLNRDFDTYFNTDIRKFSPGGHNFLYGNFIDENNDDGYTTSTDKPGGYGKVDTTHYYEYPVCQLGEKADAAIAAAKDELGEGEEDPFSGNNYTELQGDVHRIMWDEDGNMIFTNVTGSETIEEENSGLMKEYYAEVEKKCKEKGIDSEEKFAEDTDLQKELFQLLKDKISEFKAEMESDMSKAYYLLGDEKVKQLQEELDKIGLTEEALDRADYYNDSTTSNADGEQLSKVEPYIVSVEKHWYRNVYFTLGAIESESEKDYVEEHYPDWDGAYETAESDATTEYDFQPGEDSNDQDLAPTENGRWVVVEKTISGKSKTQVRDAVRGEVNAHTKELFVGTADKPAKYFVYDGSRDTAELIDDLRENYYNETYKKEKDAGSDAATAIAAAEAAVEAEEAKRGTNCFKEVDVRSNALAAFSILENNTSEDAEYILRDLKNLFVDLGYFTKEELKTSDTHVFQWPLSGYLNPYWPQKRFEKQQRDYGTLIRSKVSTDNIRNGHNPDGSERTENQEQSFIYEANLNPDATVTAPDTSVPEDDEEPEGEEQDEITNPTDTLEDGFEAGLNVVSPVTGEIIEEGSDYIKIKVMDNTAISEYEPFYNKYKDVCTGYIMYIKGFKKTDINSNSVSEYQKVTHTDAYFTKYGYDQAGMEKWREDEDKRVEAPAYIEKDGKRYIKEGTVIGTTTNSDIVMYLINRENSLMEDVESYIRLSDNNLDTDWAYFYWVPYESGGIDGEGNGPEAVGQTTSGELAVGIAQWTTTNKSGGVNNIPDFCKKAIELNSSLCAELRPFVGMSIDQVLAAESQIRDAFQTICRKDRDGFTEVQMQVAINENLTEPLTGTEREWLLDTDPILQGTYMSTNNWSTIPSRWFAVMSQSSSDEENIRALMEKACTIGSTAGNLSSRWTSQYVLAMDLMNGTLDEEGLMTWIKTKQPYDKYGEGKNMSSLS